MTVVAKKKNEKLKMHCTNKMYFSIYRFAVAMSGYL